MLNISKNIEEYKKDFIDEMNLFGLKEDDLDIEISLINDVDKKEFILSISLQRGKNNIYRFEHIPIIDDLSLKRHLKKNIKSFLYICLSSYTKRMQSWGSLTGVRPAKLVYDYFRESKDLDLSIKNLKNEYLISDKKAQIIKTIVQNQMSVINTDNDCCLYIHIPICPSRCVYCSFVSTDFKNAYKYMAEYVKYLTYEIRYTIDKIKQKGIHINSIYVGGGTPTVLSPEELKDVLIELKDIQVNEFTVECGRADTITKEKLQVLKHNNVTRISINPQTFNDDTLRVIGRNHTAEDVLKVYKMAQEFGFDINMDLIAGLPNENLKIFKDTINKTLELSPTNITIHTLSIKNAGLLRQMNNAKLPSYKDVEKMLDFSYKKLEKHSYAPYYLYRQKNMIGMFENVGFSKVGHFSLFNIYSMEDMKTIIACGAGAISKIINKSNNKVERIANVKQIKDYISRHYEMMERKKELLDNII